MFRGKPIHVKRDDLIDPCLSGNKFRKLYALTIADPSKYSRVISYGGNQSNAMLSIACLCHQKEWRFEYVTKTIPEHLRADLTGNLKNALSLGMQLREVSALEYEGVISDLKEKYPLYSAPVDQNQKTLFIRQGGADPLAESGVNVLAAEIEAWRVEKNIDFLSVITPSGTGTTAFYLAKALPGLSVYTTALIGTTEYLMKQLRQLGEIPQNLHFLETEKKYRFGNLYPEFFRIQNELKSSGVEFDYLYAPKTWLSLAENLDAINTQLLYVHSGGVSGNETMVARYKRFFERMGK